MVLTKLFKSLVICSLFTFCISCSDSNQANWKLIPVRSADKWGYINQKGKYMINPQFTDATMFRDGLAMVTASNGKMGFIDENGKYKIPAQYKRATPFFEGMAWVVSDGGHPTCITKSGEIKFVLKEAQYVFNFSEGLAMYGTKDKDGKVKIGFVDKSGKVVINPQFEEANPFSESLASFKQKDKWGFIDKTGKIVINPQFDLVGNFKNGKAVFKQGEQWGYIDTKGAYIINPQFEAAGNFNEGMAIILQGNLFGYITEDGKIEINPQFDDAGNFSSGMATIKQNDRWGFIDKKGKISINPQFEDASQFYGKIAFVESADKWGIIDKKGKYLVNPQFDQIKTKIGEFFYVLSDYYDASKFINLFMEKLGDNAFDGFTASSTLQNIVDNPLYEDIEANDKYIAFTDQEQVFTDDIKLSKTQFHFSSPIYENYTTYENYWGYSYATGTSKTYKFDTNVAAIEYQFDLSGDATSKGGAIAKALQNAFEAKFNLKFEQKDGQYFVYQDGKLSFGITYSDYGCSFFVGFNKTKLQQLMDEEVEIDYSNDNVVSE